MCLTILTKKRAFDSCQVLAVWKFIFAAQQFGTSDCYFCTRMKPDSKQQLKDEKIRQMQIAGAEAVIQGFLDQGFKVSSEFGEERAEMQITLHNGKTITIHSPYESLTQGPGVLAFIQKLDR